MIVSTRRCRISCLVAVAAFVGAGVRARAQSAPEWSIEESTAPETTTLDYVASEGTWISLDVSPDGRNLVFDLLGHIYEMPIGGGEATALTRGRSWNMFPRYSPDGTRIAFTSDRSGSDDLWVLVRGTGALTNVSKRDINVWGGSWSSDGRHLYAPGIADVTEIEFAQYNLHGTHQTLVRSGTFSPMNAFVDDVSGHRLYYEHRDRQLPASGSRIKSYDKATGEVSVYLERPGGAAGPSLSPDGRYLAYVHRNDLASELVLHDLQTRGERVLRDSLDRDRQDYGVYHHGAYPGMSWHPGGGEIFLTFGGGIRAVDVKTGAVRQIPFRARVQRELDKTIRFRTAVPDSMARTRAHRWAQRTERGIVFETLGDLYLQGPTGSRRNLTNSSEHETSPIFDTRTGTLYYAAWSDDELGAVYAQPIAGGARRRLTARPTQYGALTLSGDGRWLAFLRGNGGLRNGVRLQRQNDFELMIRGPDGAERKVTDVSWEGSGFGRQSPSIVFGSSDLMYFTEFVGDTLTLKRVQRNGADERVLYQFPHASRAVLSPDYRWIMFHEYHRSYVTPFEFVGKPVVVSAEDHLGFTRRIDRDRDGFFQTWSAGGDTLSWTRGGAFYEKAVADILADSVPAAETHLAFNFPVAVPSSSIALTGARVITMNPAREVLENATIVIRNHRIEALGAGVRVPPGAQVYDLRGHSIMPGIVDVHAHYDGSISPLQVIEQRMASLLADLAHGVTTMYEVYGSLTKDFWVSDMLRQGGMEGPRLFSVGSPMYGTRKYRPKTYRAFASLEDVREQVRLNKAHGATALKDYLTGSRRIRHQLATAAREEGLNIVVEPGGDAQLNFARVTDGMTGIAHGMGFTPMHEDVVTFLKTTAVGITPTLLVFLDGARGESFFHQSERLWENAKLLNFTRREDLLGRFRRVPHIFEDDFFHAQVAANLKRLYDAGVSMQLGGHGQMLGLDAHWEMELFTQGGFTPYDAIAIATINGARHQGLDADLGSIEAGKLADLIVLRENPLADIRNTRAIRYVMKNGVLYNGGDASRVYPHPKPAGRLYFDRDRSY